MPYTQSLQEQQLMSPLLGICGKEKKKQIPGSGKSKKRYLGTGILIMLPLGYY